MSDTDKLIKLGHCISVRTGIDIRIYVNDNGKMQLIEVEKSGRKAVEYFDYPLERRDVKFTYTKRCLLHLLRRLVTDIFEEEERRII